jgi:hypothetical protein
MYVLNISPALTTLLKREHYCENYLTESQEYDGLKKLNLKILLLFHTFIYVRDISKKIIQFPSIISAQLNLRKLLMKKTRYVCIRKQITRKRIPRHPILGG